MSQDTGWHGYYPQDGWVENNKINSDDQYLLQEEQFRKWHNIEYIFTEKGLSIALTLTKTSDATCTEKGYERWTEACSICGTIESNPTPPLGHDYEKIEKSEPTCTKAGYEEHYQCKRTGCTQWAVDGEPQITKATELQDGKVDETCTRCPEGTTGHLKTTEIAMASDITLAETSYEKW